ncbi:uncharacterized protein LOC120666415 isoform X2 [Panicum virgatum]|uniref:Uncharacterized protein n=1 Tax=Panicum virgatum TaxID=38727 RepID=A0A8T0UKE3_PANVG|nr:uncharacterized protein LOC120666415 isoform X2 [Panicum virgatum]KAG2621304.1 hypothetical protein PVAP13_3NG249000 [Panicum virgatum]
MSPATGVRSRTRPAPVRWPATSSSPRVCVPEPEGRLLLAAEEADSGSGQRAPCPPDTMGDPAAADLLSTRRPPSDPATNVVLTPPPLNSRRCSMSAASRWRYARQVIHDLPNCPSSLTAMTRSAGPERRGHHGCGRVPRQIRKQGRMRETEHHDPKDGTLL